MSDPAWMASVVDWLRSVHMGGVVSVNGMPRTGKSRVLKACDGKVWTRRVVFDPYDARDRSLYAAGESPAPPWPGVRCSARDLVRYPRLLLDKDPCRVVVVPSSLDKETLGREFSTVARVLWATGRVELIAEECGLYSRQATDMIMQLASGGGHALMRLWLVSQSFGRIQKDGRRHVSHLVSFAQGEESDLDDLRKKSRALAERVRNLRPGMAPALWRLGDA